MGVNGLSNIRLTVNELPEWNLDNRYKPEIMGDPVGFNPTINQAEYFTPQNSPYGNQIIATPRYGILDYFPTFPLRGVRNYVGAQRYGHPVSEQLYWRFRGYRGILPINELPLINRPYPYQVPIYSQFGEA